MLSRPLKVRYSIALLTVCFFAGFAQAEWLTDTSTMMGTEIRVELWADDVHAGKMAQQAVFTDFKRLDEMMNPWNAASELARVNREASLKPAAVSPEIIEVVQRARYYSELSSGAFDISFASAGQLYDYREGEKPSAEAASKASKHINYRAIEVNPADGTIAFGEQGMAIDLGGIAKGYAVDRGIEILKHAGITSAIVSAGGDSRVLGDLGDRPRTIGIRHPRKKDEFAVLIPLENTAISTSGDYERYFIEDGVRYHHILNPVTGTSATGVQSASVIAPLAIDSDALSTTVFVLGVADGLALINRLPDVDAIVIDGEGKLHYSEGLLRESAAN